MSLKEQLESFSEAFLQREDALSAQVQAQAPSAPSVTTVPYAPSVTSLSSPQSIMTDKQLHVLTRKHLLIMIRDLEEELKHTEQELDHILLAYRAGAALDSPEDQGASHDA